MSGMQTTFYTSTSTPLYSTSWIPSTTGQYAGTCSFLIVLAIAFRTLLAARTLQARKWQRLESTRQYRIAGADEAEQEKRLSEDERKRGSFSDKSIDGTVAVFKKSPPVPPWRISQDVPRACLDVVIAGVGYLL